jgi:hypothetical protein
MIDDARVAEHRARALSPEHPVIRGTSQNPDVFFQSRERANPYYDAFPDLVQAAMDRFGELTGRRYRLFEYLGAPDAERVIVLMGSGAETARRKRWIICSPGARRWASSKSGCSGPSPRRPCWPPCRKAPGPSPCWTAARNRVPTANRSTRTW